MFLFFTFAVSIFFCGIVGVNISRNWSWDVINADTVYDTEEFREAFSRTLDRAVQADIYYQSEDRVSKGAAVDRNDLLNGFKRYYGIIDGIITGNTEIKIPCVAFVPGCWCFIVTFMMEKVLLHYMPEPGEGEEAWYYNS